MLAEPAAERRWLLVDRRTSVDLGGVEATHLVLMHFCDAWRDESGERPRGVPVGWVTPVGEPLVGVHVRRDGHDDVAVTFRRRFEVNEGIIGWGSMAFLAVPHRSEAPVDWRGPHPALPRGRYAPPGHAGPMTVLPASWGTSQTGVEDHVPDATDDLTMWLHAIEVGHDGAPAALRSVEFAPLDGAGSGRTVVVAAMTAFSGSSSPLRWGPRRSLRLSGAAGIDVDIDLGLVARRRPIPARATDGRVTGWGVESLGTSGDEELELTAAEDAVLRVGDRRLPVRDVGISLTAAGGSGVRVTAMAPVERRLQIEVVDPDGQRIPARVRAVAGDGRYLPPLGHRAEVNPGLNEDLGADIIVGGAEYAYVDGDFEVDLPADGGTLEVVSGMHRVPTGLRIDAAAIEQRVMRVQLEPSVGPDDGRWVAGDTHVHFLSPPTALLQARAEGINVVHLLACQWGDHHTSTLDLGGDQVSEDGEHMVWVGTENRQNMLGHIGLVGAKRTTLPISSGGPPEGPIGAPVTHLMADWLSRCRRDGGLAIGAHFPLPTAEVPADIAWEQFDALEFETFDHTLENPPITGWYRYLDAGYRLPVVGGTDKMTASVPLGQIRTFARLADDAPLSFDAWAEAVRAGRTFVTSGPILELRVDGHEPGATIELDEGATLEVELRARSAQPIISAVELIHDGSVVAFEEADPPADDRVLRHVVRVERSGWLAARCRSPYAVGSAFATAMAAHTSPVYLECGGSTRKPVDLTEPIRVIDGTRAWLEHLAPIRDPDELRRFQRFLDEGEARLRERSS